MINFFLKLFYTIVLYFIQPLIWLRLLLRKIKNPNYKCRFAERYGFCKKNIVPEGILLHSVSVGETLASISLVHALHHYYPSLSITMTTMTHTGFEQIKSSFGKNVHHTYLPYDLPCAMNRFLNTVRPKIVIIMETELWPNMISIIYNRKIPLVIANARLSEHSAKGYMKLGRFMRDLLNKITLIAAQNEEDGARFISLGLKHNKLSIIGNLKFDFFFTPNLIFQAKILRHCWAKSRPVWIAGSIHKGEEYIIAQAHQKLLKTFPNLLLILVPRHPERFREACKIVQKAGFNFILRSSGKIPLDYTQVVIGDTMGELLLLYGIADLAFVGGSLIKKGGHNPLEPSVHALPILVGPHIFNFKDIYNKLQQAGGLIKVVDSNSLVKEITNLLINQEYRMQCGKHAVEVLYRNQGALFRLIELLRPYFSSRIN